MIGGSAWQRKKPDLSGVAESMMRLVQAATPAPWRREPDAVTFEGEYMASVAPIYVKIPHEQFLIEPVMEPRRAKE